MQTTRNVQEATLCYIVDRELVLMLHRVSKENDMHEGLYVAPGGKLTPGETPLACVIREVREETGLEIISPTYKGKVYFDNTNRELNGGNKKDWLVHIYLADQYEGDLKENCLEGKLKWVEKENLLTLPMHEGDEIFVSQVFKKGTFLARFTYEGKKLAEHTINVYE